MLGLFTVAAISLAVGLAIGIVIGAVLMGDSMADPYDKEEEDTEEW